MLTLTSPMFFDVGKGRTMTKLGHVSTGFHRTFCETRGWERCIADGRHVLMDLILSASLQVRRSIQTTVVTLNSRLTESAILDWRLVGRLNPNTKRLCTLMARGRSSGVTFWALGLILVDDDVGKNLNIWKARQRILQYLGVQAVEYIEDFVSRIALAAQIEQPLRDGSSRYGDGATVAILSLITVLIKSSRVSLARSTKVIQSLLLTLANREAPVPNSTMYTLLCVFRGPFMDASDLLLNQIALQFCIFFGVAIPASLIMLSAVMDPNMRRNKPSAHLISTKDVGDGLTELGVSIAVRNVHANQGVTFGIGRHWRRIWVWVCSITGNGGGRRIIRMVRRRGCWLSSRTHGHGWQCCIRSAKVGCRESSLVASRVDERLMVGL